MSFHSDDGDLLWEVGEGKWSSPPQVEGFDNPTELMEWFYDYDSDSVRETCIELFDQHLSKVPLVQNLTETKNEA